MRIIGWIFVVLGCFLFVGIRDDLKEAKDDKQKQKKRKENIPLIFVVIIFLIVGFPMALHHTHHATAKPKTEQTAKQKASSSSKEKQKKIDAKTKKANERQNFKEYQAQLKTLPNKTHGAIKEAYYSETDSATIIVINNEIEATSDTQVKSTVHAAWQIGQNTIGKYEPFPESENDVLVTIQDEDGLQLAHTSAFGSFKYDGNK